MKILSVDDSPTIRLIVKRAFAAYDVMVFEAANGEEGLTVAAAEMPDLIVLDITMPVMNGVTMLGKLKENADLKSIPVIMLTAESGREDMALITRLGACDCVVKPFKDAQLVEKVMRVVPLLKKAV